METAKTLQQIENAGFSVAIYSLPSENAVSWVVDFGEAPYQEGHFVFAPFGGKTPTESKPLTIRNSHSGADLSSLNALAFPHIAHQTRTTPKFETVVHSQAEHVDLIKACIAEIHDSELEKVIAARAIALPLTPAERANRHQFMLDLFVQLTEKHTATFASLVYTPQAGWWIGATPETLIAQNGHFFSTMSLAGTRLADSAGDWGEKEKTEQKLVTEFIQENLEALLVQDLEVRPPKTLQAGAVEHICSNFTFVTLHQIETIASVLHPTPAVCGRPIALAQDFISKNEQTNRSYYAGFLGPVGLNGASHLFVNLRNMTVDAETIHLFVGGGITADSDPEAEWVESENKAKTLLRVIDLLRN